MFGVCGSDACNGRAWGLGRPGQVPYHTLPMAAPPGRQRQAPVRVIVRQGCTATGFGNVPDFVLKLAILAHGLSRQTQTCGAMGPQEITCRRCRRGGGPDDARSAGAYLMLSRRCGRLIFGPDQRCDKGCSAVGFWSFASSDIQSFAPAFLVRMPRNLVIGCARNPNPSQACRILKFCFLVFQFFLYLRVGRSTYSAVLNQAQQALAATAPSAAPLQSRGLAVHRVFAQCRLVVAAFSLWVSCY